MQTQKGQPNFINRLFILPTLFSKIYFRVSYLGIWWCHEIWICKIKFDVLENKRNTWSKIKTFVLVLHMLSFRLTLSWRRPLSYRNQSINLLCKSMDWFLYDNGLRHEKVKKQTSKNVPVTTFKKEKLNVLKKLKNGSLKSVCVGYLNLI